MKTWVKFENGKLNFSTKLVTIENEVINETPTVNNEIIGTIGDLNTITKTIKMKKIVINSVFLIPSWTEAEKSSSRILTPVTYVLTPGVLTAFVKVLLTLETVEWSLAIFNCTISVVLSLEINCAFVA